MLYGSDDQFSIKEYFLQKPLWVWVCIVLLVVCGVSFGAFGIYQLVSTNEQEIVTSNDIDNQVCEKAADFGQISVYISGAVVNPGVYILDSGSRIADLLEVASGISKNADKAYVNKQFNLAKKLSDGDQLYIPTVAELEEKFITEFGNSTGDDAGNSNKKFSGERLISINSSTKEELTKLSGIGDVRASKIIENRPYKSVSELVEKSVISESLFNEVLEKIEL